MPDYLADADTVMLIPRINLTDERFRLDDRDQVYNDDRRQNDQDLRHVLYLLSSIIFNV